MIIGLSFFPLPDYLKLLCQFSSRCTQNAAEDSFPLFCFPSVEKYLRSSHSLPPVRWVEGKPALTRLSLCLLCQRCQSCRWQLTSPDSRWRRSLAWTSTGASASHGAPLEPRRAKKHTSESLVSALITKLSNSLLPYSMSVCVKGSWQDDCFYFRWLWRI